MQRVFAAGAGLGGAWRGWPDFLARAQPLLHVSGDAGGLGVPRHRFGAPAPVDGRWLLSGHDGGAVSPTFLGLLSDGREGSPASRGGWTGIAKLGFLWDGGYKLPTGQGRYVKWEERVLDSPAPSAHRKLPLLSSNC